MPLLLAAVVMSNANADSSKTPEITTANAEFVYKYLLGEIAGQRGDLTLASQLFLDLAKQTRDPRLAERAARSAAYARQQRLALDAAVLWAEPASHRTDVAAQLWGRFHHAPQCDGDGSTEQAGDGLLGHHRQSRKSAGLSAAWREGARTVAQLHLSLSASRRCLSRSGHSQCL